MSGSTLILGAYAIYALVAMMLFVLRPTRQAALITYFGGWLILPVALYDSRAITPSGFTLDIIGTALPSDLFVTKALIVPLVGLIGLAVTAPSKLRDFRFRPLDAVLFAFCLTPLLAFAAGRIGIGDAVAQAAYLAGVWGGTWMIGRLVLNDEAVHLDLVKAMAASGLFLLPIALIEGLRSLQIYSIVFGGHPFHSDGVQRYFGARPLAFFEHGNQYGIWIAMSALAALYLAQRRETRSRATILLAAILTLCALASQSIGAILLLLLGVIWISISVRARHGVLLAGALLLLVSGGAYLSGKGRIERLAYGTSIGQTVIGTLKSAGRGSFSWRVHRDLEALETIHHAPLTGYGHWDWWRPLKAHPWGLPLLLAGQFGLLSLALLGVGLLAGPIQRLWRGDDSLLPILVILAAIDAWLNSFIYFPAVLAAAATGYPFRSSNSVRPHEEPSPNRTDSRHAQ